MLFQSPIGGVLTFIIAVVAALAAAVLLLVVTNDTAWALLAAPVALVLSVGALHRL